ncbi:MAG: hypothetical protein AAFY43_08300 [Pseudomonadota bacterium]
MARLFLLLLALALIAAFLIWKSRDGGPGDDWDDDDDDTPPGPPQSGERLPRPDRVHDRVERVRFSA